MAKPQHAKRSRPRPAPVRQHRKAAQRAVERRAIRELERWRRAS